MLLDKIEFPKDLKQIPLHQLPELAKEIRDFILDIVSTKEGHLGASLGVVELSIALHYFYNTPYDTLLWDVGHQAYVHKLLTGRKSDFDTLRQLNGMSGFPNQTESEFDAFGVGHSSTSISAITGMAYADKFKGEKRKHIAVIGDASIASGMAFEALNNLGSKDLDICIILNDNNIGIDPSVGALKSIFNHSEKAKVFFELLGFQYLGNINGHNFHELFDALNWAKTIKTPKIIHIKTIKGKGFEHAEKDQVLWHAPGKFNKISGERIKTKSTKTYPQILGESLLKIFEEKPNTFAVTPAMLTGSALMDLKQKFPKRVVDVGIAEQHAVTFSAGLACQNIIPFCVIYSTFLQRAYDQVIHDVALQSLPVIFCIDRAGLVGNDGATHHGYFDITFMNAIPHMIVACPIDEHELKQMLSLAVQLKQPMSIRYPKSTISNQDLGIEKVKCFKSKILKKGEKIAILSTGTIGQNISKAIEYTDFAWVHFPFVKPLDTQALDSILKKYKKIVCVEEGIKSGGFGESVASYATSQAYRGTIIIKALPDEFVTHGDTDELLHLHGLSAQALSDFFSEL